MKKNKKGFTLVEILAVIVVLIIISIIAINKVSQVMRTNNENATKANAVTFIKVIEDNTSLNRLTGNFNDGSYTVAQLLDMGLNVNGTKPSDGSVLISDGKVLFACLEYEKFTFQGSKNKSEITKDKCGELGSLNGEFEYTGTEKSFKAIIAGTYKIEVWGAAGGAYNAVDTNGYSRNRVPGYGSYSVGEIYLKKGDKLYINVGGKGESLTATTSDYHQSGASGGYNGGGNGGNGYNSGFPGGSGGGGATSVALVSGLLSSFSTNIDNVLIVAGGGGGAGWETVGGSGGGYLGKTVTSTRTSTGGTQVSGYQFGQGSSGYTGTNKSGSSEGSSGSGGGFFGGSTYNANETNKSMGGAGGSGYIGNYKLFNRKMYCYDCDASSVPSLETESISCVEETPTEKCAKSGNGYAKITYVIDEDPNNYKYLYSEGNEFKDVTGGWIASNTQSNGRTEKLPNNLHIYCSQTGSSGSRFYTSNSIDFTGYTKIHVVYQIVEQLTSNNYAKLYIGAGSREMNSPNMAAGYYHDTLDVTGAASAQIILHNVDANMKILQVYLSKD